MYTAYNMFQTVAQGIGISAMATTATTTSTTTTEEITEVDFDLKMLQGIELTE